jgi:hypothetical protein
MMHLLQCLEFLSAVQIAMFEDLIALAKGWALVVSIQALPVSVLDWLTVSVPCSLCSDDHAYSAL